MDYLYIMFIVQILEVIAKYESMKCDIDKLLQKELGNDNILEVN